MGFWHRCLFFLAVALRFAVSAAGTARGSRVSDTVPITIALDGSPGEGLFAWVYLGTPPQPLRVMLDSWSSELWLPSDASVPAGSGRPFFQRGNSSTWRDSGQDVIDVAFPHLLLDGGPDPSSSARNPRAAPTVDVDVGMDVLRFASHAYSGGKGVHQLAPIPVTFGAATREDPFFALTAWDGMLGVGLSPQPRFGGEAASSQLADGAHLPRVFSLFVSPESRSVGAPVPAPSSSPSAAPSPASQLLVGGFSPSFLYGASQGQAVSLLTVPLIPSPVSASPAPLSPIVDAVASSSPSPAPPAQTSQWRFSLELLTLVDGGAGAGEGNPHTLCAAPAGVCSAVVDVASPLVRLPPPLFLRVLDAVNSSASDGCVWAADSSGAGLDDSYDTTGVWVWCPSGPAYGELAPDTGFVPLPFTFPQLLLTIQATATTIPNATSSAAEPPAWYDLPLLPKDYCAEQPVGSAPTGMLPTPQRWCKLLLGPALLPSGGLTTVELGGPFLRRYLTVLDGRTGGQSSSLPSSRGALDSEEPVVVLLPPPSLAPSVSLGAVAAAGPVPSRFSPAALPNSPAFTIVVAAAVASIAALIVAGGCVVIVRSKQAIVKPGQLSAPLLGEERESGTRELGREGTAAGGLLQRAFVFFGGRTHHASSFTSAESVVSGLTGLSELERLEDSEDEEPGGDAWQVHGQDQPSPALSALLASACWGPLKGLSLPPSPALSALVAPSGGVGSLPPHWRMPTPSPQMRGVGAAGAGVELTKQPPGSPVRIHVPDAGALSGPGSGALGSTMTPRRFASPLLATLLPSADKQPGLDGFPAGPTPSRSPWLVAGSLPTAAASVQASPASPVASFHCPAPSTLLSVVDGAVYEAVD